MDKRTGGIIATVVTVLLCGCPGFFTICFGAITSLVAFVPDAQIDMGPLGTEPSSALTAGIGSLCLGLIFIAIPIAVGFFTLRNKPAEASTFPDEPTPPAI